MAGESPGGPRPVPLPPPPGGLYFQSKLTYNESDIYLGAGEDYLSQMTVDDFDDWERNLATTYGAFVSTNAEEIDDNARFLLAEQVTLVAGLLCVSLGVII